jgi:putative ABC transport system permease protein
MKLTLCGIGIGLFTAWCAARLMASLLFGLSATDLATFSEIAFVLAAVGLLACYLPARSAMRMDPLTALRHE